MELFSLPVDYPRFFIVMESRQMSKFKILVETFFHFSSAFVDAILILPFSHMKDNLKCKVFWEEVTGSPILLSSDSHKLLLALSGTKE